MRDYFPLNPMTRYEYDFKSTEFEGIAKVYIDIINVTKNNKSIVANARMIFKLRDEHVTEFKIKKDNRWVISTNGIVVGGRKEIPVKPKEGFKWDEYPDQNEIVSMTDKLVIKGGKFKNVLKVLTRIAGGDAGMATRYYAPGVGYVMEVYDAEDKNCFVEFVSLSKLKPEDLKIKKGRR